MDGLHQIPDVLVPVATSHMTPAGYRLP